jgi:hypothetical protein
MKFAARPHEIAQRSQRPWQHDARANQAVAHELREPLTVLHVRLAPGHGLDVLRVPDEELEAPLEHRVDGSPVHHTPVLSIPTWVTAHAASHSGSASNSGVVVPKVRTSFVRALRGAPEEDARNDGALIHIQPAGSFDDRFRSVSFRRSTGRRGVGSLADDTAMRATPCGVRLDGIPLPTRVDLLDGLWRTADCLDLGAHSTRSGRTAWQIDPRSFQPPHRPRFIRRGAARPHEIC